MRILKIGLYKDGQSTSKVKHSGLTDSPENHFEMRAQHTVDKENALFIVPLLSKAETLGWQEQAYDFFVIPKNVDVLEKIGALKNLKLDGKHSISSSDERVKAAFESLSFFVALYVHCMKGTSISSEEAQEAKKHFSDLLRFIQQDSISVPKLPDKEVTFRLGSFSKGVCPAPGETVTVSEISGHPAPNPILLHGTTLGSRCYLGGAINSCVVEQSGLNGRLRLDFNRRQLCAASRLS